MKKVSRKSTIVLIGGTILLVALGSLLLKGGINYSSKAGMKKLEKVQTDETPTEIICNEYNNSKEVLIENPKPINKNEQEKLYNSMLKNAKMRRENPTPIYREKHEALYQEVKDKINIQKEDAKVLYKKKIQDTFGDLSDVTDEELLFINMYASQNNSYEWLIQVDDKKDKQYYECVLNAINGEFTKLSKCDYTGLNDSIEGTCSLTTPFKLKNSKINLYTNKLKEIINENNILNSKDNSIKKTFVRFTGYTGLRPYVIMEAEMQDRRRVDIAFYVDTDELLFVEV